MLGRTLEPELMDDPIEVRLYNDMDHVAVNTRFVEDLIAGGLVGPDVIDLGTGTALIPVILCQRLPQLRVMAVDAAVNMLEVARYNIELDSMLERIQLSLMNASDLNRFQPEMFDTVISNSLIHHLPEPIHAIRNSLRLVKTGGRIFMRDLLRPENEAKVEALVALHAATEPAASQQTLRQSLHAALTLSEVQELLSQCGVAPESVCQTSDRHWTWDTTK
jgi:ubiquinone/menaquinone biosynthesis C-methylase UbiE